MTSKLSSSKKIWNTVRQLILSYIDDLLKGEHNLTFLIFTAFITDYFPALILDGHGHGYQYIGLKSLAQFKVLIEKSDAALYYLLDSIPQEMSLYVTTDITNLLVTEVKKLVSLELNNFVYSCLLSTMMKQYPEFIFEKVRPLFESAISNSLLKRESNDPVKELNMKIDSSGTHFSNTSLKRKHSYEFDDSYIHYTDRDDYVETSSEDKYITSNSLFTQEFFDDASDEWRKNKTSDKHLTFYYTCCMTNKSTGKKCGKKSVSDTDNLASDNFYCKTHLPKKQKIQKEQKNDVEELLKCDSFDFLLNLP